MKLKLTNLLLAACLLLCFAQCKGKKDAVTEEPTLSDEALASQLRVPVVEEFSQVYTVKQALEERVDPLQRNSAHVSLGSSVVVNVTVEGRAVPLREDFYQDAVKLLGAPLYASGQGEKKDTAVALDNEEGEHYAVVEFHK